MSAKDSVRTVSSLSTIIDSVPTAVVVVDNLGGIVLLNTQTESLFGYSSEQLLGEPVEQLIPERFRHHHPAHRNGFMQSPTTRPMGKGRDLYGLRSDGKEFPIEIGLNPIRTETGMFVVAAIVDLTERKRQEEQLRQANEALEHSNLELQQFAYIASHDLKTPLRAVTGYAQCLQQDFYDSLGDEANFYIERMVKATERMSQLISDLLTISRVDSSAKPFTPVDMDQVFDDVCSMLSAAIDEVDGEVLKFSLPQIRGDRAQLTQLLMNLVANALKYHGGQAPRVKVSAADEEHRWLFVVEDNGIGIEPQYYDKVFEIFRRLHTQKQYPGTGIGLAICRRIVHRHGGEIWLEPSPDQGCRFCFSILKSVVGGYEDAR